MEYFRSIEWRSGFYIPIVIVSYRNVNDVVGCLEALEKLAAEPAFDIYICENGGSAAFNALVAALTDTGGPCVDASYGEIRSESMQRFVRVRYLKLSARDTRVFIADAKENFGYAGAANAWLHVLLGYPGWPGAWILNPDTEPALDALKELVEYAAKHHRGMVGSRLGPRAGADVVRTRGLSWRKWRASTLAVDLHAPAAICPPPDEVDRRLDAPSGASVYVTRDCIEQIGLMDERYFLYFEDLDWGLRAKKYGPIGYAHQSIVVHKGGTTIGTSISRMNQSPLAVYLDFRNRLLFVRRHFAVWLPWTFLAELVEIFEFGRLGAFRNMLAAMCGMGAGLVGRTGRPDNVLRSHLMTRSVEIP